MFYCSKKQYCFVVALFRNNGYFDNNRLYQYLRVSAQFIVIYLLYIDAKQVFACVGCITNMKVSLKLVHRLNYFTISR